MAYTLGKTCAKKKLCKRTVLLQFIIENVVTCFLERMSVEADKNLNAKLLGLYEKVAKSVVISLYFISLLCLC